VRLDDWGEQRSRPGHPPDLQGWRSGGLWGCGKDRGAWWCCALGKRAEVGRVQRGRQLIFFIGRAEYPAKARQAAMGGRGWGHPWFPGLCLSNHMLSRRTLPHAPHSTTPHTPCSTTGGPGTYSHAIPCEASLGGRFTARCGASEACRTGHAPLRGERGLQDRPCPVAGRARLAGQALPTFQAVREKVFPALPSRMHRLSIPGKVRKLMCSAPLSSRCSYTCKERGWEVLSE